MNFATALQNESKKTFTENGATAFNTTNSGLLDFFSSAGSVRGAWNETNGELRVQRLFSEALKEDKLLATKALFYVRDIRSGLGERLTFRNLLKYAACQYPEIIRPNIFLIPEYGRFDDLYALIDTPLEKEMWLFISMQLESDIWAMNNHKSCSLLAKWLKTADASSKNTRELGIKTAINLGLSVYEYKRIIRQLRKYIDVTEVKMSSNEWDKIEYSSVPSKAMLNYTNAFKRHDGLRFDNFIHRAITGEAKINASTLYPYDLIEKYITRDGYEAFRIPYYNPAIEAQWQALPDYVGRDCNAIVIADTSGSMWGRPLYSAIGLAIYFAQRNTGAYHNLWMSFSRSATVHCLKGDTLAEQLASIDTNDWNYNTDLEAAFDNVLNIAIDNHVKPEEMIKSIIVISDMEIDQCSDYSSWLFYDKMVAKYHGAGYEIPNLVFWNVDSRHDIFHADKDRKGVQLCSGQAASTFTQLMQSIGKTPMEMMLDILNSERYSLITIGENK